jgi:hypothetical protein
MSFNKTKANVIKTGLYILLLQDINRHLENY